MKKEFFDSPDSKKEFFSNALISWFYINKRKFQWRVESDPFKILIAEVMLQRTRAEQVHPIYLEFIKKYNEPRQLASCNIDKISNYFKRLGLLWRGERIILMADYIMKEHGGSIPQSRDDLLKIPGIGDYIADAVLVFAFNHSLTVIDSNVIRLVSRFFGFIRAKGELRRNKNFRDFCRSLVDRVDRPDIRNFNWALLDHGYLICKPAPRCHVCPLSEQCYYFEYKQN